MRPRRLTPVGRVVIALYAVVSAVIGLWLMRDLDMTSMVAAVVVGVPVAAVAGVYARRLAVGR